MKGKTKEDPVPFLHLESNVTFSVYSTNGKMWFVKTGNKVPEELPEGGYKMIEEEIGYPLETFIGQFLPSSVEAYDLIREPLLALEQLCRDKITTINNYLAKANNYLAKAKM